MLWQEIEPSLVDSLYDVFTFCAIIFVLYIRVRKNKLSIQDFILLSGFCSTVFFFNNVLIEWGEFPDQLKYLVQATAIRSLDYEEITGLKSVLAASIIYSLFPIISFTTVNAIAFINKGLIIYLFIFFKDKKVSKFFLYSLIFYPSIIIYSSLSLRDILTTFLMLLAAHFFFIYRYKTFLIFSIILFLIKPQNALFVAATLMFYKLFIESRNFKKDYIILSIIIGVTLFYSNEMLSLINKFRLGFFAEANGYTEKLGKYYSESRKLSFSFNSFYYSISEYIKSHLYPMTDSLEVKKSIFFLDNILYTFLYFLNCAHLYKKNKKKVIFWIIAYILINILLVLIAVNEMTFLRYKFPFVIFFIFCLSQTCNKAIKKQ